ncbi:MAG: DUF3782 domain-containing protein [candidate division WOR-3 bacterium]
MKKILTEEDIVKIIEKRLPEIIEKSPFLRLKIEEIMDKRAVTREEIKEILNELKAQRGELIVQREELKSLKEELIVQREELKALKEELIVQREELKSLKEELIVQREELKSLRKEMVDGFKILRDAITALGARWGIFAEEAFRESMEDILKELGFYDVKKWEDYDKEGMVFGYPSTIEVDLVIKDDKHYLIEIKSSVSDGDVLKFKRIGEFYEKKTGVKPELFIVSPYIREEAKEKCKVFGIKFYRRD